MKKPIIVIAGISLSLAIVYLVQTRALNNSANGLPSTEEHEEQEKQSGAGKAMSMFWWTRAYPDPYYINDKFMDAWKKAVYMKEQSNIASRTTRVNNSGAWTPIGPRTLGGRMLCIAINPLKHTTVIAGSASGGLYRSYTGGTGLEAWQPMVTGYPTLGVTSILYHPTDTNIIYAGTGEIYRTDSSGSTPNPNNTPYNVWKTRGTYSVGLLKSMDGGGDWTQAWSQSHADLTGIQNIRFDPTNPNIVFICATNGLYKYNATTGVTTKILNITYVSDVMINPSNTAQIVAAVGNLNNTLKGIYRTTTGNNATPTWTRITSTLPAPVDFDGYIKMDYHAGSGNLFASIGVREGSPLPNELFRSADFGATWVAITSSGHADYQHWFSHCVAVDPNDRDAAILGGVGLYKITMSGGGRTTGTKTSIKSGGAISGTYLAPGDQEGGNRYVHADVHDVEYVPGRSDSVYVLCDGGIFLSTNANLTPASITWQSCNSGLQTAQFYGPSGQSATDANFFLGGLQDNGTTVYDGVTGRWKRALGGDGGPAQVHPTNDNIVLASNDARGVSRSSTRTATWGTGGAGSWAFANDSRTGFMAPLIISKSNPNVVYLGSDNLHKSTDAGVTFSFESAATATNYFEAIHKTAVAMAVSPINENKIWVSISPFAQYDNNGDDLHFNPPVNFMKTTTGNTPFTSIYGGGLPTPNRYIMDIAIHPTNDDILWVVLGGFGSSHVYKSIDGGTTWTDIDAGNLPDVPTTAITVDPANTNIIYVGNDIGMYVTGDGGITWNDFNGGLWDATMITDIHLIPGNKVRAVTYGKGVFDSPKFTPALLPVNIISFTGTEQGSANLLKWTVDQEINLSGYEIQKSSDGMNFQPLTSINARNSLSQTGYSYSDGASGISWYYRLKAINGDGTYEFSKSVFIRRTMKEGMTVRGEVRSSLNLSFHSAQAGDLQLSLYDATGRLVRRETVTVINGLTQHSLTNVTHLPKGIYQVEAVLHKNRWTKRIVKD